MTRTTAAASLLLLAAAACGDLDEVDVTRSGEVTIPGAPGAPPLDVNAAAAIQVALGRDAIEAEGIDPNDVDAARLRAVRLEVVSGSSLETWLDEVSLDVEAPGLPRVRVAQRAGIRALPAGTTVVDLETTGVDLKPYVLAPSAVLTPALGGTAPASDTTIRATATLRVDVSVSGLFD
jgi:hypothetical protein